MANLAGYDVIGELHIESVVDLLNLIPITNPLDGKTIHLFGGPFSTDLNVGHDALEPIPTVEPIGIVLFRVIIEAAILPVIHQSRALLNMKLSGGSTSVAGRSLSNVGGQAIVSVPLGFALPHLPSDPAVEPQVPVFLLSATDPDVVLDAATRMQVDAIFGEGGADRLTAHLRRALAAFLALAGTRAVPALGFRVLPGVDSDDPSQLSAPPIVAWIDDTTLGVFGYYRAAATGGDVGRKNNSDIVQTTSEFFYDGNDMIPGRRVALLVSADAFHQVMACPAIRNELVGGLVAKHELNKWSDFITARDGNDSKAWDEMNAWLNSSNPTPPEPVSGQDVINALTPPPCGLGSVEIAREPVDLAQSDVVAMLRRFEVFLDEGRIVARFNAGGNVEIIIGDVAFDVDGEVGISFTVNGGVVISDADVKHPNVVLHATGFLGIVVALENMFTAGDGIWNILTKLFALKIRYNVAQTIAEKLPHTIRLNLPQDIIRSRMADVQVHPESLLVVGLICRHYLWNAFSPTLFVDSTVEGRVPAETLPVHGKLHLEATDWDCPAAEFDYTRTFWDETFTVRARARDIPLPITLSNWRMQLGNFSWGWLIGSRYVDPEINWSGETKAITTGHLNLMGNVEHLDEIFIPSLDGPLGEARVGVDVLGDASNGWHLRFFGADGNFYVLFTVDARDGAGKLWSATTFIIHRGEQLQLPPEYEQHRANCDQNFKDWFRRKASDHIAVEVVNVGRGDPFMNNEILEGVAIRDMIAKGDRKVLNQTVAAVDRFGSDMLNRIGKVHLRGGI